jgi:phenylalanyl-tRNA synthetase beta chain
MRTESSSRFEKGLDPENCMAGLLRACELVQLLGAGDVVDGVIDVYPTKPEAVILPLDVEKINKFIGVELDYDYMKSVLERLECKVEGNSITVPSFRNDLTCMQDIAEEIIRIYGYNKIKSTCIYAETTQGGRTPKQQFEVDCEYLLYGMGFDQIQTFSFISPKYYDKIRMAEDSSLRKSVVISNPLGEDTSVMRTTALPSMMEVVARNINFSNEDVRLFEMATTYVPQEGENLLPNENKVITLAAYGSDEDFYSLKGVIENILEKAGIEKAKFVSYSDDKAYHSGRCAKIFSADGRELGIFGQIHPLTAKNYDVNIPVYAAELSFDAIFDVSDMTIDYKPLPKFPAVSRDFSFVCDEELEVGTIAEVMEKAAGKLCEGVKLFDVFRGEKIGTGKKSVAFRVTLRASDRTLTVEEADKVSGKILKDLSFKLGLNIRG